MEQNNKENELSTFNMAVQYLRRIDELLYKCNIYCSSNEYRNWNSTLMALFITISPFMSKEEMIRQVLYIKNLDEVFADGKVTSKETIVLAQYEMFLRKVCHAHDLLLPSKDDISKLMDKGMY